MSNKQERDDVFANALKLVLVAGVATAVFGTWVGRLLRAGRRHLHPEHPLFGRQ